MKEKHGGLLACSLTGEEEGKQQPDESMKLTFIEGASITRGRRKLWQVPGDSPG